MSFQTPNAAGKVVVIDIETKAFSERFPIDANEAVRTGTARWPTPTELSTRKIDEPAAPKEGEAPKA